MVIREIFINIDVIRPDTLLKNTGEPHAVICFIIDLVKCGFVNFKSAFFITNGIIAIPAQSDIEIDAAIAEPTTSISHTRRKNERKAMVKRFEQILIIILIFTNPLIRR